MSAKRTICLSKHFHPSKLEAEYCSWLLARWHNKEIKYFKLYPSVPLMIAGKTFRRWKIDFLVYENDGSTSYHEAKGYNLSDDSFKLKRDAFLICYPNIKLYVNKELYNGKPVRKSVKWRMADVVRRNKKAAASRKKMLQARKELLAPRPGWNK